MAHLVVLGYLLVLVVGIFTFSLLLRDKNQSFCFTKVFSWYLGSLNLQLFFDLFTTYFLTNEALIHVPLNLYTFNMTLNAMYLLVLLTTFFFFSNWMIELGDDRLRVWIHRSQILIMLLAVLLYIAACISAVTEGSPRLFSTIVSKVFLSFAVAKFSIIGLVTILSFQRKSSQQRVWLVMIIYLILEWLLISGKVLRYDGEFVRQSMHLLYFGLNMILPLIAMPFFRSNPETLSHARECLLDQIGLTDREREVADRIFQGKLNKEIALELQIVESTVKFHTHNLYKKAGATNRIEFINRAYGLDASNGMEG